MCDPEISPVIASITWVSDSPVSPRSVKGEPVWERSGRGMRMSCLVKISETVGGLAER